MYEKLTKCAVHLFVVNTSVEKIGLKAGVRNSKLYFVYTWKWKTESCSSFCAIIYDFSHFVFQRL